VFDDDGGATVVASESTDGSTKDTRVERARGRKRSSPGAAYESGDPRLHDIAFDGTLELDWEVAAPALSHGSAETDDGRKCNARRGPTRLLGP